MSDDRLGELQSMVNAAQQGYDKYTAYFDSLTMSYSCSMDEHFYRQLVRRKKSALYFPYLRSKSERLAVAFIAAYFTNRRLVQLSPMDPNPKDDSIAVDELQQAVDFYLRLTPDLYSTFNRCFQDVAAKGTGIIKVYWDTALSAPRIDYIRLRDGLLDPVAENFNDLQFFVHKVSTTREGLEGMAKTGDFDIDMNLDINGHSSSYTNVLNDTLPNKYQRVYLYDVYEKFEGRWFISTLLGEQVIRNLVELQDGLPFFMFTAIPQLYAETENGSVACYGLSPVETILPLQDAMNQTRNSQIDAISLQLNPRFKVTRGSNVDANDLKSGPGTAIYSDSPGGIEVIPPPNLQQSIFDIQTLSLEMQQASGITDFNQGINSTGIKDQTATGIVTLTNEANQKIEYIIRCLNETGFNPALKAYANLCWKYGDNRFFKQSGKFRSQPLNFFAEAETGLGATSPTAKITGLREAMQAVGGFGYTGTATALLMELLPLLGITRMDDIVEAIKNDTQRAAAAAAQEQGAGQPQEQPANASALPGGVGAQGSDGIARVAYPQENGM